MLFICVVILLVMSLISVSVPVSVTGRMIPIYKTVTDEKKLSLSFNCAESADDVEEILDILDKHNVKATFFPLGIWAQAHPGELKMISQRGHEIGNHSYSHADCVTLSRESIYSEIVKCNDAVAAVTGVKPVLFRCPSGSYDNKTIEAAQAAGMTVIQWSIDSVDWRNNSPDEIYNRVVPNISAGDIIQFHTGTLGTAAVLDRIITDIEAEGYTFVPVGELIYPQPYTVNHAGAQSRIEDKTNKK